MRFGSFFVLLILLMAIPSSGLTIEEAKEIALKENRALKISELEVRKAEAKLKESWAAFYPGVQFQSSYTRLLSVPQFSLETPEGTQTISMGYPDNYKNTLSVTFPLFTFGKRFVFKRIAEKGLRLQELQEETDKISLLKDLATIFYGVVSAKKGVEIAKEAIERAEDHLKTVTVQYEEGRVTRLDFLSAETDLNERKTTFLNVLNGLEKAHSGLNILLGFPVDTMVDIEEEIEMDIKPDTFILNALITQALKNRPEVKGAQEINAMANLNNTMQYLSYLPTIAFVGNFSYDKPCNMVNEWDNNITATIALTMPIFEGFSRRRKIESYILTTEQAKIREMMIREGIKMEVKNLLLDYRLSKKKLDLAEKKLEQSRELYRMAKEQYEKGYISSLQYKDIELGYRSAEFTHLNSIYNLRVALSKIKIAVTTE